MQPSPLRGGRSGGRSLEGRGKIRPKRCYSVPADRRPGAWIETL